MADLGFFAWSTRNATLDAWFGSEGASLGPSQIKIRLYTDMPTVDDEAGMAVTGGGYDDLVVDNDAATWGAATDGVKLNLIDFDFGIASADWGLVQGVGYLNAFTDAIICAGPFATPPQVTAGDSVNLLAGDHQITLLC